MQVLDVGRQGRGIGCREEGARSLSQRGMPMGGKGGSGRCGEEERQGASGGKLENGGEQGLDGGSRAPSWSSNLSKNSST